MPRIVKADARLFPTLKLVEKWRDGHEDYMSGSAYYESDTIEIKKGWRPEGYENPTPAVILPANVDNPYGEDVLYEAFEAGFDACIEAMENQK